MGATNAAGQMLRITLVLDEALEKWVIDQAVALGVESYICCYCSGKPLHEAYETAGPTRGLVRVELLLRPGSAAEVLGFVQQLQRRHYPITALLDRVTVCAEQGHELLGTEVS
jgi:hypothetical protein